MHLMAAVMRHLLSVDLTLILATWVTAGLGAAFHYAKQHEAAEKSVRGFLRFALPAEIFRHPSCRRDYLFAVVGHFTEPLTACSFLLGVPVATLSVYGACKALFGAREPLASSAMITVATLLVILLVQDFITWFSHWVEHKSKIMWEVHKVHHSVEFLTPISNRRHHPWQFIWESGLNNAGVGLVLGAMSYACQVPIMDNALLGVDAYFFASMLSFYHLRHSHIPLHYGRFEKYFLSPAQHQLHHSVETADWDKNFGLLTSIWDRLFGTIRYTTPGYRYRIGLQAEIMNEYDSVWKFLATPPVNIAKLLWRRVRSTARTPVIVPEPCIDMARHGGPAAPGGIGDALLGGTMATS